MRSDFGLYKLAMYSQPFILGSLVLAWFAWRAKTSGGGKMHTAILVMPFVFLAALGLPAESHYVRLSAGRAEGGGAFVEVPEASAGRLSSRLQFLGHEPHHSLVVSDTSNVVLAKVEAPNFAPFRQEYTADDYFTPGGEFHPRLDTWYAGRVRPGYIEWSLAALNRWHGMQKQESFDMHGGPSNPFVRVAGRESAEDSYSLLASGPLLSAVNRRRPYDPGSGSLVSLISSDQVSNRLVQVDSLLGKSYFRSAAARPEGRIAMFQLEPDYFYPGQSISAVGRVILFEVLRPTPGVRLELEYTASLQSDGRNTIPPVQAIGAQRSSFGAMGRGSARLFSPPLEPQMIAGRYYVAIDMGVTGQLFPHPRSGLMRWFGNDIPLDTRRTNGFVRDVSALDADQYDNLQAPTKISNFPSDLSRKSLEYSGIYEDSWVGEQSFLWLQQPAQGAKLMVRAMVPPLGQKSTTLHVFADGKPVADAALHPGDNEVQAIVEGPAARRRIDLRFDSAAALPGTDGRVVSAQLKFVGFTEAAKPEGIAELPIGIGAHWYPYEKYGGGSSAGWKTMRHLR